MAVYTPGNRGTIRASAECSVKEVCAKLYEAMKGIGTNETAIIDVLSTHSSEQRQRIKKKYGQLYGKDLVKELDSEVSFSFGKLVLAMMVDSEEFLLDCIHKAICSTRGGKLFKRFSSFFKEGLGGAEHILIGLLCARSNADLKAIKEAYEKRYGDKLEDKIAVDGNHIPHDVCSFILDMISGERDEQDDVDVELLAEDIQSLSTSKNEDVLHTLLQERSFLHLKKLFDELMNVSGKTVDGIIDDLQGEISVELQEAYRSLLTLVRDGEPTYYAERVKGSIEGAGTDDDTLIKVLVLRAEVDLLDIMEAYEKKYKAEMASEVGDDTSGDYKALLMRILTKPLLVETVQREEQAQQEERIQEERIQEERVQEELLKEDQDQAREDQAQEDQAQEDQAQEDQAQEDQTRKDQAQEEQAREEQALEKQALEKQALEEQAREEREPRETFKGIAPSEEMDSKAAHVDEEEKRFSQLSEHVEDTSLKNDDDESTITIVEDKEAQGAENQIIDTEGGNDDGNVNHVETMESTGDEDKLEVAEDEIAQLDEQGAENVTGDGKEEAPHEGMLSEAGSLEGKLEQAAVVEETGSPIVSREL